MKYRLSIKTAAFSRLLEEFILVLCGFFVFSPIGSIISQNLLHLPLALPEILFLPFLLYFIRINVNLKINFNILWGILFVVFFAILGILHGRYGIASIISTTRGYLYIVITFFYFKDRYIHSINTYWLIALGSSFGWAFLSILSFVNLRSNISTGDMAVYGNMITISLLISIPLIFNDWKKIFLALLIAGIITITAGVRRQLAVLVLAIITSFFLLVKPNNILKISITLFFLFFIGVLLFPKIDNILMETSPTLHYRIITKTKMIIAGESSASDNIRITKIKRFLGSLDEYIWPKGFVSKRTMKDEGANDFMDYPFTELFYTFGFILLPFMFFLFLRALFFHIQHYYLNGIRESAICLVSGGTILLLIMIEGSFLNFTFTVPATGFVLGRIFSRKNLIR